MSKGTQLSETERSTILALRSTNMSAEKIAKQVNRSANVVRTFLKSPVTYGTKKSTGRPRLLSKRTSRKLQFEAGKTGSSARDLKTELNLDVSIRTVQRVLNTCNYLTYCKKKTAPKLTNRHRENRLSFARANFNLGVGWRTLIFSDEKKFNLDGPDGFRYYWRDLRRDPVALSKRQNGGGSVMVWGAFSYDGKSELAILSGNQNAEKYIQTLSDYMLPFATSTLGLNFRFQQNNASIHKANVTLEWLKSKNIDVLDWPALSPDLNPIENLWGILARKVYAKNRQFSNVEDLREEILFQWRQIKKETLETLINSMDDRLFEVILRKGATTKY